MNTDRTFIDDLKHQMRYGSATIRLIIINCAVFLVLGIIEVLARLSGNEAGIHLFLSDLVSLHPQLDYLLIRPWGLITSIFVHFDFIHLLMNMLFLYFSGQMFESIFGSKRLMYTYIFGGLTGSILEVLAHLIFPVISVSQASVVGASGAIMAIFTALAFYRPKLKVNLFGILPVPMIVLAAFFILSDIFSLGKSDGTAHFAHLGGVLFGALSIQGLYSKGNIVTRIISFVENLRSRFKRGPKLKVKKGGATRGPEFKSDEDYNQEKKQRQEKIDAILDKISKSGYDSLTKEEKDFLFNQSNR
ncbi:MAG: rhomboid family intramembrane serine protease [Cryomorphaceae bacterium]|jgi:membrane associated rhomboid family serine protease|nr:rhomboid family intramembrane serine protease [Cryomorphaceae bacterium]